MQVCLVFFACFGNTTIGKYSLKAPYFLTGGGERLILPIAVAPKKIQVTFFKILKLLVFQPFC